MLTLRFLAEVDPALAHALYGRARTAFVTTRLGLPVVLEYLAGFRGAADIDSGPLPLGVGLAATVVGLSTARALGDSSLADPLDRELEALGLPVQFYRGAHTDSGWCRSARRFWYGRGWRRWCRPMRRSNPSRRGLRASALGSASPRSFCSGWRFGGSERSRGPNPPAPRDAGGPAASRCAYSVCFAAPASAAMLRAACLTLLLLPGIAHAQTYAGELRSGDATLESGEYTDTYEVRARRGQTVAATLTSSDFDPYLMLIDAAGEKVENDDCTSGDTERSCATLTATADGTVRVIVTSYAAGETGRYRAEVTAGGRPAAPAPTGARLGGDERSETGTLARGDATLATGEFYDTYTFEGTGGTVPVDLRSDDFDPYVIVRGDDGTDDFNDDFDGALDRARLVLDTRRGAQYTVTVTSYAPGEAGRYRLAIGGRSRAGYAAPAVAVGNAGSGLSETFRGTLDQGDRRLASGEFAASHAFEGQAGEPVRVVMESTDFDPYLIVRSPSGEQVENDDAEGSTDRSVVEFVMPESGRYAITATSYAAGETGRYTVRVSQDDAMQAAPASFDRIVGVFVGISEYARPGLPPLRFTAQDAETVRDAMVSAGMAPRDGILLQDSEATVANVRRAFRRLGAEADARTQFVFFYSGHGGQYARTSFERQDPDNLDESIEMYDAPILDDELDEMLTGVPAGRELVVLDACYSGGFAKDIISQPNRMGLFSSEEDVVSQVAARFEAGGYLSRFFSDAVVQRAADTDRNGSVTALELSQYLHDRYDADVQGAPRGLLSSGDTGLQHQKLVVDRGSVRLAETLFVVGR